jgi:hypothetical protein
LTEFDKIFEDETLLGGWRPMKKLIQLTLFTALVLAFSLPVLAQTTPATTTTPAATQDDAEAKAALYSKFRDNIKSNPPVAYEAGKEYLQKYEAKDGAADQYVAYIKKWVTSYDKLARRNQFAEEIKAKNYNQVFVVGKQILAEEPEDLGVLYELSKAGLFAATNNNESNNADAVTFARKTIQLIQSGRTFEKDKPITGKDEILGGLNYALGIFLRKSQPAEAVNYFISAAGYDGFAKKDPQTYALLAATYEEAEYSKLRNDFNNNCKTEEQLNSATCTELTNKVNAVLDRMIDALARAIAYSKTTQNPAAYDAARNDWMTQVTALYKYRNGSEAGLNELIAGVASKPLPKPGDPAKPMTTPTTTPASTTTTPPSGSATQPATTTPANGTQPNGKATTPAQPAGSTSTKKATPRRSR